MDPLAKKVAARYAADIVPLRPKPTGPTIQIAGKKYALSDYFPMLSEIIGDPQPGGAKLIDVGGPRFSYLWVYDTDRKAVAMFRVSDGDEKVYGTANQFTTEILTLERRKQLNRVTNAEFRAIHRWMNDKQDETLKAMKEYLEAQADEWDKLSKKLVRDLFEDKILPGILRRWEDLDKGVKPLGFKANPNIPRPPEDQAKMFVANEALKAFSLAAVEDYIRSKGFDPDNPPGDGDFQAVDWARQDVIDEFYEANFKSFSSP